MYFLILRKVFFSTESIKELFHKLQLYLIKKRLEHIVDNKLVKQLTL